MSQSVEQSLQEDKSKVTENRDEISVSILPSSFRITETSGPNDRNYELRHWRGSMVRWQENGSLVVIAQSREAFGPNTGYLDVKTSGYAHLVSDHNIKIAATGCKLTGGGEGGSDQEKSLELFGAGDIHIQSDGKGGIYITAAKNIEFRGDNIIFNAAQQISMNTGSKEDVNVGESSGIGSGKFVVSTGSYELATSNYAESVTGAKKVSNTGSIVQEQKVAIAQPTTPNQHITSTETVGSLVHKVGYDYVLEVDGKMLLKVNNNPAKAGGGVLGGPGSADGFPTQVEALVQEIRGTRATYIKPGTTPPYGNDYTEIELGNSYTKVKSAAPSKTGWSVETETKGDCIIKTSALGDIGIQAGATPSNNVFLKNLGGSVRIEASGAAGMIDMKATTEIRGTAIKINLN